MREFSWRYFTLTGDIDAYLLYKQHEDLVPEDAGPDVENDEQQVVSE